MDYKYIRAWGAIMGSKKYYIDAQVDLARKDGAPPDAIYHNGEGRWHVFSDVTREDTREVLQRALGALKGGTR